MDRFSTFDTYNLLHYTHLPSGFTIALSFKHYATGSIIKRAIPGRAPDGFNVTPLEHSLDGSYVRFKLTGESQEIELRYYSQGRHAVLEVVPLTRPVTPMLLIVGAGFLWNKAGNISREHASPVPNGQNEKNRTDSGVQDFISGQKTEEDQAFKKGLRDRLIARSGEYCWTVTVSGKPGTDYNTDTLTPYLTALLSEPVYVSTSETIACREFTERVREKALAASRYDNTANSHSDANENGIAGKALKVAKMHDSRRVTASKNENRNKDGSQIRRDEIQQLFDAMRAAMAWNTFYEPNRERVITGVSRDWNVYHGGYVLFCWDSFFASLLASEFSKELAYANFRAILQEAEGLPFVPNTSSATGFCTRDRSQPPVGAAVAVKLYRKFGEPEFLCEVYPKLRAWHEWFLQNRKLAPGLFTWGSQPYAPRTGGEWEQNGVGALFGAALESGMDNSPLYDATEWLKTRNLMAEADVGLTALMLENCYRLREIAYILHRKSDILLFDEQIRCIEKAFLTFWNPEKRFFFNRNPFTGCFNERKSAVQFYAFFYRNLTPEMLDGLLSHFYNPKEFFGPYMLPSISRDDPAFYEQNYWRGRIWPPHNFLVYEAMKTHSICRQARINLAECSKKLILKEWREQKHVHENYHAITGLGCDLQKNAHIPGSDAVFGSDCLYNWGGLLARIALEQEGIIE